MKTRTLIFLLAMLFSKNILSQIESYYTPNDIKYTISTRIGINSLNQLNLQFEKPLNNRIGIRANLGYNYGPRYLVGSGVLCSAEPLLVATNKKGIIVKMGTVFYNDANYFKKAWSVLLDYRRSSINDLEVDEGCSSGSNAALIKTYDWNANDIGIMIYRDLLKHHNKVTNMYFGIGTSVRFEEKEYSSIRSASIGAGPIMESDLVENNTKMIIRCDLGIRLKFTKFQ